MASQRWVLPPLLLCLRHLPGLVLPLISIPSLQQLPFYASLLRRDFLLPILTTYSSLLPPSAPDPVLVLVLTCTGLLLQVKSISWKRAETDPSTLSSTP